MRQGGESLNSKLPPLLSTMPKVQIHEHTTSYQAITVKSPHGLVCLKRLFLEYDSPEPSRTALENLFARDFTDNENESTRSIGREEAIDYILSTRQKCAKHQIDLKRAMCIEYEDHRRHDVFFEGVRFMLLSSLGDRQVESRMLEDEGQWIRIPFSGRLEVRVKENRFRLKEAVIEVVSRRTVEDKSALVKRDMMMLRRAGSTLTLGPASPRSEGLSSDSTLQQHQTGSVSQVALPPAGVNELPAMVSASRLADNRSLPPYQSSGTRTPTVTSEGSVVGEDKFVQVLKLCADQPSGP